MKPLTDNDHEKLVETGRLMAQDMMRNCFMSHRLDDGHITRTVYTLRSMALHILATEMCNRVKQGKCEVPEFSNAIFQEFLEEYNCIKDGDMELLGKDGAVN